MKARDLRKAKAMTGNKSIKQDLSQLELRVIGLVGAEYIEGNKDCAENIPEEKVCVRECVRACVSACVYRYYNNDECYLMRQAIGI